MPVSLQKGQKVSLTKGNPGLKKVVVGLGWDVNQFDTGGDFDLDAAAFLLTDTGKVSRQEDRFIRIYVDILKKQLYICVTNSMEGRARRIGDKFFSTKGANHGFGLLRIDSIVEKYHGYLNRQAEDGVFATEVTLPLE